MFDRSPKLIVHFYETAIIQFDAGDSQREALSVRFATRGDEEFRSFQFSLPTSDLCCDGDLLVVACDRIHFRFGMKRYPLLSKHLRDGFRNLRLIPGKDALAAL